MVSRKKSIKMAREIFIYSVVLHLLGSNFVYSDEVFCELKWVSMSDGVKLATEIHRVEDKNKKKPVIIIRTPYNYELGRKKISELSCDPNRYKNTLRRGYVVVKQDVRGTVRSEGVFRPIHQEASDTYEAVEWAAIQSWSNGKVGLMGASYNGVSVLQGAVSQPPSLVAVSAAITGSDYHDNWVYVNGVFNLSFLQSWLMMTLAKDEYRRQIEFNDRASIDVQQKLNRWVYRAEDEFSNKWNNHLPLMEFSEFREIAPYYYEWLEHPSYDEFWSKVDLEMQYFRIRVPVRLLGGWYDIFSVGTIRNFQGIRENGGNNIARTGSQLIMVPECHTPSCGVIDFGWESDRPLFLRKPIDDIDWWDHWLKGKKNASFEAGRAVEVKVMFPPDRGNIGDYFTILSDNFPMSEVNTVKFYLQSDGRANSRTGNGKLLKESSKKLVSDQYIYDPHNPVPTVGGNLCCSEHIPAGPFDQSAVEMREDVLVYTSEPLVDDLVVVGNVKLKFWAKTNAKDTDFTAKLVDVHLDGFAQNILDRVVRARFQKGSKYPPLLIKPNEINEYGLDLGPTATVFRKGHKIRLEISSSNFPQFARNTNVGKDDSQEKNLLLAVQNIFHGPMFPSNLEIPFLEKKELRKIMLKEEYESFFGLVD